MAAVGGEPWGLVKERLLCAERGWLGQKTRCAVMSVSKKPCLLKNRLDQCTWVSEAFLNVCLSGCEACKSFLGLHVKLRLGFLHHGSAAGSPASPLVHL